MTKLQIIFIIVTCVIIPTNLNCMITNPKFKPSYIQVKNSELEKWRESGEYEEQCDWISRSTVQKNSTDFRCFQYALYKTTGFTGAISFPAYTNSISIEDFFEQTQHPQPNDLVVYTIDDNNREMRHFAVVIDSVTFASKWGPRKPIWRHRPFDVPSAYGNAIWFFTLKEKYKTPEGEKLLIPDIERTLMEKRNKKIEKNIVSVVTIGIPTGILLGFVGLIACYTLRRIK